MISLIHPSRGRAKKAASSAIKWIRDAGENVEYILSIDKDDDTKSYIEEFSHNWITDSFNFHVIEINENRSAIDAINNAANKCTGDIIIVMSDDFDCPPQWATCLLKLVEGKRDWIAKTNDGIQPWLITLPIMDRVYYDRFGYVYHPDYRHMFADTHMSCVADITGRKINLDIQFNHNHYSVTPGVKDAVSERCDSTWAQGEKLFLEQYEMNFGLPKGNPIQDGGMIEWLKLKNKV